MQKTKEIEAIKAQTQRIKSEWQAKTEALINSIHATCLFELNCCMLCRCLRYIANTSLGQYFITIVYFKVGFLEMHSRMLVVGFCRQRETFPSSICFIIEAILSNFLKLCPPLLGENLLPLVTPPWHLRVQL